MIKSSEDSKMAALHCEALRRTGGDLTYLMFQLQNLYKNKFVLVF